MPKIYIASQGEWDEDCRDDIDKILTGPAYKSITNEIATMTEEQKIVLLIKDSMGEATFDNPAYFVILYEDGHREAKKVEWHFEMKLDSLETVPVREAEKEMRIYWGEEKRDEIEDVEPTAE